MTYTAYDGKLARLCSAISSDLKSWIRLGPVFKATPFNETWSKSGSIITKQFGSSFIAQLIRFDQNSGIPTDAPRFGMFFGDSSIFFAHATEADLLSGFWTPVVDNNGNLKPVISWRAGYFDSSLTESGPPSMDRNGQTLLLYNGMNCDQNKTACPQGSYKDPNLPDRAYSSGQLLVNTSNPFIVIIINRLDNPFMTVTEQYEEKGNVDNVVFIEGLAFAGNQYYLYYGCADTLVSVAVCNSQICQSAGAETRKQSRRHLL